MRTIKEKVFEKWPRYVLSLGAFPNTYISDHETLVKRDKMGSLPRHNSTFTRQGQAREGLEGGFYNWEQRG
jgi:hypothetical protein